MLGTDLKYTFRSLARQKLSTGLVVSMLTLAIAANVVVFGLVNGLFLRPFPFPEPDRLVYINETAPRWNLEVVGVNYPDFVQWRQAAKLFEHSRSTTATPSTCQTAPVPNGSRGFAPLMNSPTHLASSRSSGECLRPTKTGQRPSEWSSSMRACGAIASAGLPTYSAERSS